MSLSDWLLADLRLPKVCKQAEAEHRGARDVPDWRRLLLNARYQPGIAFLPGYCRRWQHSFSLQ